MSLTNDERGDSADQRWAPGEYFGLPIPADLETLVSGGPDFLTQAFRASSALSTDNSVRRIVESEGSEAGGSGMKARLTVAYEAPVPGLAEELFIKFSRHFDNELRDSARLTMISEVNVALLARSPDFPVLVPAILFADIDPQSGTGLIISECIPYGRDGVEPRYVKCMDYDVPDQVGHYKAILRGLATLSGAHQAGRLPPEVDRQFPYSADRVSGSFWGQVDEATIVRRAIRLFDFIARYPRLFPANVRTSEFREQFMRDIPDVIAAGDRISQVLYGNRDFIAFAHWNANIDNCWFEQEPGGPLQCGFLDWANAGQLSVARSIVGAISGAENFVWDDHLDELLGVFIDEYAAQGGPLLDLDELRHHILLLTASGLAGSMGAPIALTREFEDIDILESRRDSLLRLDEHENARIQLHMTTRLLHLWQTRKLGDVVRSL